MSTLVNSVDKKELWSVLSELRNKKSATPLSMSDLETHFSKLLNTAPKNIADSKMVQLKSDLLEFINATLDSNSDLLPGTYNSDFLIKVAKTLKNGKSAFLDGATNEVLKHSMVELSTVYSKLLNPIA